MENVSARCLADNNQGSRLFLEEEEEKSKEFYRFNCTGSPFSLVVNEMIIKAGKSCTVATLMQCFYAYILLAQDDLLSLIPKIPMRRCASTP